MPDTLQQTPTAAEVDEAVAALHRDGIVGRKGAFTPEWSDRMREDIEVAFTDARTRERGAVGRGPARWYVAIHPEQLRGFVDLVTHPWLTAVCEAVLGPDYEVVELGFDIPFAGAKDQPWHRDFAAPPETYRDRRLTSLAFNLTGVDTTADMGPFEIAVGTQFERGEDFLHGMFPDRSEFPRFAGLGVTKMPQRGDMSARSALTVHRGTANRSETSRPVLILGVDARGASPEGLHDMTITREFADSLPAEVRRHLGARVVDRLEPIVQTHLIEGLVMGEDA